MDTAEFARFHHIPLNHARAYFQGRQAAIDRVPYRYPQAPSPQESWYFAGYADVEQERQNHHV